MLKLATRTADAAGNETNGSDSQTSSRAGLPMGPVLLALPAMKRNTDVVFDVFEEYSSSSKHGSAAGPRKKRKIIVGETGRIQLGGTTVDDDMQTGRYAVVVFDPETEKGEIIEAPVVQIARTVKATTSSTSTSPSSGIRRKNLDARNVLGEAFGSKKRQQQIRSQERNQVEMDSMGDVVGLVSSVIDERVANTAPPVDTAEPTDASRPPFDLKATKPEDAYQLDDIFVPADLADLDVGELLQTQPADIKTALATFHISEPSFAYSRLEKELNKAAKQRSSDRVKKLIYAALLIQFFSVLSGPVKAYQDPGALAGRLGGIPLSFAQSLLGRFAMQKAGEEGGKASYGTTSQLRDKLACYIIVACLSLEGYELDISTLARDMRQSQKKISDLAKFVGCKTVKMTIGDAKKIGAEGQPVKAVLSVPLMFPQPSRGRR